MGVSEILHGAKFAEDSVEICLRIDLIAEKNRIIADFVKAKAEESKKDSRMASRSTGENPFDDETKAKLDDLNKQIADNILTFHMRAISSDEYNSLQRMAGPPRKDNLADQSVGFNQQNFYRNLVKRLTYKVSAPDGDEMTFDEESWRTFWTAIIDAQLDDLSACAHKLCRELRNPTGART